ncbi:glycoside hydrolase family 30 beta sandwich domain-containing protein [Mesonia sp.]|uniref:glycoside hydrolase family 30 protein n=1 Tax=Mesonia sp. TaxID=1960830 RepID=UPI00175858F3|nr:glycoside hydrolase family 30 beta sandwich domain-containing protein [Mesonia sp.]HIB37202.1 glucan endo-1,6-beta-glucosidase [Mesonia sp.]HIO26620.1 glucan endo-1,6-beta-glucosidase [Flavobacteriaceae bacterium]
MKKIFLSIAIAATLIACSDDDTKSYPPPTTGGSGNEVGTAQIWVTSGDQSRLLSAQDNLSIIDNNETTYPSISINESEQMQEIEGFGAALTGSSAYLINNLNAAQKNSLLSDLFNVESGAGMSYLRLTMGASDFSLGDFTYNDLPQGQEDATLANFSIAQDEAHVIPVANSILSINPEVKFMGSPWSAPAWMKTNESLYGGKLVSQWYETYANYFVKYIQAYQTNGITIDAVTPQNEPLHTAGYPTMRMEADEQADFIKNALGPAFAEENISTKIIAYDHNFDEPGYPMTVLDDADANQYVSGSAFHAYAGQVSAMSQVHNAYPDKGLYFTEISGGEWSTDFSSNLRWYTQNILIGTTKNWSKTALFWNLALDENHGPTNNGCQDCRGVVTINSSGEIEKNEEYYAIAHFSKFVRPGAYRIGSSNFPDNSGLSGVAFQNPDGSKVLIVLNETPSSKTFSAIMGENRFDGTIAQESVATITWQ